MNKSLAGACKTSMDSLYSYLSMGVTTHRLPAGIGGQNCLLGHCFRRVYTHAAKALVTPAESDALFICSRRETTAGGQA